MDNPTDFQIKSAGFQSHEIPKREESDPGAGIFVNNFPLTQSNDKGQDKSANTLDDNSTGLVFLPTETDDPEVLQANDSLSERVYSFN